MGMVFGKTGVEEPPYTVLLTRSPVETPYEIRKYGERFAAEAAYPAGDNDDDTPFSVLARYIGVFGTPENEGSEKISMTAPVVIDRQGGGTAIAMTAPVIRTENSGTKMMQFMLPTNYDELSKIPKPTNPAVHILEIPPAVGAVHRFNGGFSKERSQTMAMGLAKQLFEDGVKMSEADAMEKFQFWGYNPPFTISYFRRNEVWIPLTQEQADLLVNAFDHTSSN
jgi:hypothetical protein